ncbi:MAG: tetratricopeptide repeat protein [Trueperaceae bacterium]|nr:tetratricopeptide repeat protein [Trueperaceae bacterium]
MPKRRRRTCNYTTSSAARSFQELGAGDRAVAYWRRVLELNPDDERARYFLQVSQSTPGTPGAGGSVNLALERGRSAYQRADFDAAERAFGAATEQQPGSAEAWGWLGRVYFERGAYARAARAYDQAAGLEPDNDAYTFFAGEAARLAEAERP